MYRSEVRDFILTETNNRRDGLDQSAPFSLGKGADWSIGWVIFHANVFLGAIASPLWGRRERGFSSRIIP